MRWSGVSSVCARAFDLFDRAAASGQPRLDGLVCSRLSLPRGCEGLTSRRVLLIAASLGNGGLERQLSMLAAHLPSTWRPLVWSAGDGPFRDVLLHAGVPTVVEARRSRLDARPFARLTRLIMSTRPDVVHAWHWLPAAVAAPVCRSARIPFVDGTIRLGRPHPGLWGPRRGIMRLANVVVANSQAGMEAWGMWPPKGRVVYNAFDPARLPVVAVSEGFGTRGAGRSLAAGPFTAVMTGRMSPHKDFGTVIVAARLLSAGAPPQTWKFLLAGDGPWRSQLELEARDLTQSGVVEFVDSGLEVLPLVSSADVGILMTNDEVHAEGCSNSIMEYMACGLPVVCCDSGGNRELVAHGVNGWLVPPGDPAALARQLEQLRVSGRAAQLGAAGRQILQRDFTLERMVGAYVGIYEECLAARRDRARAEDQRIA